MKISGYHLRVGYCSGVPDWDTTFTETMLTFSWITRRTLGIATALLLSTTAACGRDSAGPTAVNSVTPASVTSLSGNGQSAIVGSSLAQSLVVKVSNSAGSPIAGATVSFAVTSGVATLSQPSAQTDNSGIASTQVTVGSAAGAVVVAATVLGTSLTTQFSVTALASTGGADCSTPISLSVGGAIILSGASVCVAGSSAEYMLIPFNSATNAATLSMFSVQPSDIRTLTSALKPGALSGGMSGALFDAVSGTVSGSGSGTASGTMPATLGAPSGRQASATGRQAFEMGLRKRERDALQPRFSAARSWYASRGIGSGARFNAIPSTATVGTLVSLNSNAGDACARPDMRVARVAAVGRKALVVADTSNPAGGFTDADYASIAATFDDVVDPIDTRAFGEPSDIDANGHVVLYFTSAVNALTPKDVGYYIGGFFFGRDLFPTTSTNTLAACDASNVAEMFYLLVPDPDGVINGNKRTKTFVTNVTISTVAHEYQHLINASRRLYVNTAATGFEVTWLDEGLAHMAEELLFYGRSGLAPLYNIDAPLVRSNETYRSAFNSDVISNFGRLRSFLANPSQNSPYANNDSLATRGATWSFLRYAIDQQPASSQETLLRQLVNSTTAGLSNLRAVFGSDLTPLFRDWATSFALDDVSGAAMRYQMRSWNLPSILGALDTNGSYPLATQALSDRTLTTVTVAGGGAAYLRFGVGGGGSASLLWTTPVAVVTTLVRTK